MTSEKSKIESDASELSAPAKQWLEFTRRLGEAGLQIHRRAQATRTEQQRSEINQSLLSLLSTGALCLAEFDPDYPQWMPFWNCTYRAGASNSDNTYYFTRISGNGEYVFTGDRGTGGRMDLQIVKGMIGITEPGPVLAGYDIDDFDLSPDGRFQITLSKDRPHGHTGNWIALDPMVDDTFLLLRRIYHDWDNDKDGYITIERTDRKTRSVRRSEHGGLQLDRVAAYVDSWGSEFINILERQGFDAAPINQLENYTQKFGTITLDEQHYFGGRSG